ncbi:MAG: RNA polymerase sigma factor [Anaerolineae bacterium]|nr:RNA polymerase sigma factor [Anaerolineae bacterium]
MENVGYGRLTEIMPDSDFVACLKAGEDAATGELVARYYQPINRYLYGLVHDSQTALELAQETFLQAHRALPRLADDSNLSAWLYRIATNLARKHYRRQQLIHWFPLDYFAVHQDGPEKQIVEKDLVGYALKQLPMDQKVCLLLQVWAGLTCAEIAQAVGKSEAAVKMSLVRARVCFRDAYTKASGEE